MKKAPTLIDEVYRMSYSNTRVPGWSENHLWRTALHKARRFVLDDDMSTFLGELATSAFVKRGNPKVVNRKVDNLRMGARLPFPITWVEYNLRLCQTRTQSLLNRPFDADGTPKTEGWLFTQHPQVETAFSAHIITRDPDSPDEQGYDTWCFPVAYMWACDDTTVLPWKRIPLSRGGVFPSEVATGMSGYQSDQVDMYFSQMIADLPNTKGAGVAVGNLVAEWSGVVRRMWALLSTITNLPVKLTEVKAAKGFLGKGSYRKFLDHKTITLTVPEKHYRKVARHALAMAHRNRAHEVMAHWRKDYHHPLSPLCDHEFEADEVHKTCSRCGGRETYIKVHIRGDTSLGFVTHDYEVTHPRNNP